MASYYIYVYLDPRKPGPFQYGDLCFDYEPIYVGKGCRNRINHHMQKRLTKKSLFYNKLNKIISDGHEPIRYKAFIGLDEDASLDLEVQWIATIGRIDIETGPLCNCTEGGERGFARTEEARRKLSESKRGSKNPQYGKTTSDRQKAAVSKSSRNRVATEETRQKLSESGKQRVGIKNSVKRKDTIYYRIIAPDGTTQELDGAKAVAEFCKENKLQYHVLMHNRNTLIIEAKPATIGWQLNTLNNERTIQS